MGHLVRDEARHGRELHMSIAVENVGHRWQGGEVSAILHMQNLTYTPLCWSDWWSLESFRWGGWGSEQTCVPSPTPLSTTTVIVLPTPSCCTCYIYPTLFPFSSCTWLIFITLSSLLSRHWLTSVLNPRSGSACAK